MSLLDNDSYDENERLNRVTRLPGPYEGYWICGFCKRRFDPGSGHSGGRRLGYFGFNYQTDFANQLFPSGNYYMCTNCPEIEDNLIIVLGHTPYTPLLSSINWTSHLYQKDAKKEFENIFFDRRHCIYTLKGEIEKRYLILKKRQQERECAFKIEEKYRIPKYLLVDFL